MYHPKKKKEADRKSELGWSHSANAGVGVEAVRDPVQVKSSMKRTRLSAEEGG
jgi:hypothetical protein